MLEQTSFVASSCYHLLPSILSSERCLLEPAFPLVRHPPSSYWSSRTEMTSFSPWSSYRVMFFPFLILQWKTHPSPGLHVCHIKKWIWPSESTSCVWRNWQVFNLLEYWFLICRKGMTKFLSCGVLLKVPFLRLELYKPRIVLDFHWVRWECLVV